MFYSNGRFIKSCVLTFNMEKVGPKEVLGIFVKNTTDFFYKWKFFMFFLEGVWRWEIKDC